MDLLGEFFRHNSMMNDRLLETCRQLSDEQLASTVDLDHGQDETERQNERNQRQRHRSQEAQADHRPASNILT